jgi:hypothetical protein
MEREAIGAKFSRNSRGERDLSWSEKQQLMAMELPRSAGLTGTAQQFG